MDDGKRFEHRRMDGVIFRDCSAVGATFDDTNLAGSTFVNVNLHGATFTNVDLSGMTIDDANIAGLSFDDANLAGSTFVNVNLHGATFTDVDLSGVTIDDANIAGLSIFGHDIAALIRGEMQRTPEQSALRDYILFMHDDGPLSGALKDWPEYFTMLRARGAFQGGSAIGAGEVIRKDGAETPTTSRLAGYIRIQARDMAEARSLVAGNPVFEGGGSVEIRELPRD